MKLEKYLKPIVVIFVAIIIVLGVALRAQIKKKNEMIERANQAYVYALDFALYGLNIDYEKTNQSDKVFHYTRLTGNLQAAATVFGQTEYAENNRNFGYTLECLNQYLREQYALNELDMDDRTQNKLYNYLQEISNDPNNTKLMEELDDYIDSFDMPIPPDSLSYKMN